MVIALALLLVGGLVWLLRAKAGDAASPADTVPPPWPAGQFAGRRILDEELGAGRIVARGLTKQYQNVKAVDGLSFDVAPGRVTGLLGPNGSGKTTTLRMLLGLLQPTAGTAVIGGACYRDLDQPIRHVGAVLEAGAAHPGRTGRNHLRIICRSAGIPLSRADEVLELAGLTAAGGRKFGEYSLGMRQRLGIAAALVGDPQVLVLDEPVNGLDPGGIRWMRDLLKALAAAGRTILVSSHLLAEMETLADDLIIIAAGRLVTQGTSESVVNSMTHGRRTLVRTPDPGKLVAALGRDAEITQAGDGALVVAGADAAAIGDAAQRAGIAIHQLTTQRPGLEAAFLELTGAAAAIR